MAMAPDKTTMPVDGDAARSLAAAAKAQGFPIVRLASDSVRLTVELLMRGLTPSTVLDLLKLVDVLLGLPLAYLELTARKWDACDDMEVARLLRDSGRLLGSRAAALYGSLGEFLGVLGRALALLPTPRLSFGQVDGRTWRIVLVHGGEKSGKCIAHVAEGAVRGFGCAPHVRLEGGAVLVEATC